MNIWTDRAGAATVRALTGGNETVPTVVVGHASLANPSAAEVLAVAGGSGRPGLPGPTAPGRALGSVLQVLQWVAVVALVVASIAVDRAGHAGVSWVLDGVAVAVYLVARVLRQRVGQHRAR